MKNIKRSLSFILLLIFLFSSGSFSLLSYAADEEVIEIKTAEELQDINNNVSGHYKLMADIDLNDVDFTPIGNVDSGPFSGTFDGNGFTISNLSVFTGKYAGLFGYNEGEIKNVKLKNIYIYGTRYVGGIAAYNAATGIVKDSSVLSGSVESVGGIYVTDIGGIVGFSNGALSGCINSAKVKFNNSGKDANCGGIVGEYDSEYELADCKNYGNIFVASNSPSYFYHSGKYGYGVSGVVGKLKCFRVSKCSNYGNIKNYGNYSGGIIGISDYSGCLVKQCQNGGYLYSERFYNMYSGGICGFSTKVMTFEECLNSGYIRCYNKGGHSGWMGKGDNTYVGSIFGCIYPGTCIMRSCQNIGNLQSSDDAGSFGGYSNESYCYDCYAGGHVFAGDYNFYNHGRGNYSNGFIQHDRYNTYISSSSLSLSDFDADTKKFTNTSISNNPYLKNVDTPILLNISTGIYKVNDKFKITAYDISGRVLTDIKWSTIYGRCIVDSDGSVTVNDCGLETIVATDSQGNKANCNIYAYIPSTGFAATDRTIHVNDSASYDDGYFTKSGGNGDYIIGYKCDNSSVLGLSLREDDGAFRIYPRAAGTATITATTISGLTATQTITVTNYLTSLSLPSSATVSRGASKKLALTTTPSPTSSKITWTSSDTSVATVDQDGRVEGIKKGTSIITAKSDNGYSATCTVNVTAPVTSMEFEQPSVTLYKGDVQNLNLICMPFDTTDSVTYSVSNSSVLSVEKDGTAAANAVGQCRVTATSSSGVKAYCVVTVIEVPVIVAGISLDQTEASMKVGEVLRLISTITPSDATDKTVTWASTDETVATVSPGGTVEAKGSGKAIITATTQNGIIASCEINVAGVASTNLSRIYIPEILSTREEFIKIPVMIEHNPGISFASLNAIYDSDVLEPVEVTNGDVFESVLGSIDRDNRRIKLVFTSEEDISTDGTLAFIKFKVLDSEKQSTLKVCYYPNAIRNIQSKSVSFNLADGIIKETKCKHKNTYLKNKLDATCSSTGYTGDVYCSDCAALIESGKVIDKLQHTVAVDAAVAATCTEKGKTEGKHCSVCGEVLVKQTEIPAKGHTEVADKAIAATCTEKGKTEGKHCSVCGEVIKAQKTVAALGHKYKTTTKKATTSKDGKTVTACTVCGKVKKTTVIYKASSVKLSKTSYTYNGKAQKPKVVVKNSKGKALTEGKDYTVKYPKGMKNPGTYTVTVTFKGNYSGKKTLTFTIAPKAPTLKVTAAKKSAKLNWNKQTGATGYNVYMATSKNGKYKKIATVKGNKVSYTKTGLTKGKTYYFKVAAYTTSGGKAISGAYSAVKSVKVK